MRDDGVIFVGGWPEMPWKKAAEPTPVTQDEEEDDDGR
jgi:hypothetical protein